MTEDLTLCLEAHGVAFHAAPWVPGTVATYFGAVGFFVFTPGHPVEAYEKAEDQLLDVMAAKIRDLGGNAATSFELKVELDAEHGGQLGLRLEGVGTAARLDPRW